MKDTIKNVLKRKLHTEDSRQLSLSEFIKRSSDIIGLSSVTKTLDLGCGDGRGSDLLNQILPNLSYYGLDIFDSPEVSKRDRFDLNFCSYDGVNIPFSDECFDLIFSKQVLEHVRYPDKVISEVARVLKHDRFFVGSVSQLEPYHSHSIFNWTGYGIVQVFESHGLEVIQLAPGIDGVTLTLRRILGPEQFNAFFSRESLFNYYIEHAVPSRSIWQRNLTKIIAAGHILFLAKKS
jgi:ubiquinone/menaquinone biosynthesis C-methylase UbiE